MLLSLSQACPVVTIRKHTWIRPTQTAAAAAPWRCREQNVGTKKKGHESSSSSSSLGRGGFVRAVGAAALTATAALLSRTTTPAFAVGQQPGVRTTPPPNALLLVPALRAKVRNIRHVLLISQHGKSEHGRCVCAYVYFSQYLT